MVTIYDIAKKAGCSAMTVSRVINNTGRISDKTRQRVLAIMKEMNYVPNSIARSLVVQETRLLSLLITDITNPFYTSLARGAEDAARRLGYRLLLANSDENVEKEKEYIDAVLSARVDGVLFAPAGDDSLAGLDKLRRQNIKVVLLDREVPGMSCDIVLGDSKEGARQLTGHLIGLGHRRIALLNGSRAVSTARLRQSGYEEALALAGIPLDPELVAEADYKHADHDEWADRLMQAGGRPTALFAANNFLALGAIRALQARGLRVPADVSVVCFDELEAGFVVDPFMTVVAQPAYDFGYMGVQLLVDRIRNQAPAEPRRVILPPVLRVRKSSAPPPESRQPE
ncbi:LacI family DNA-binding transcriptional regulator [Paenibacillus humicola]|uniref:LacI family DNA-binding transcriptional regulator n=1 Tax=Paenibacillus humicola TaxID=3110540 RepID=UPI00237C51D0|nr:LacI family DNA-binding transcriptional regulator [Paenibacillus humicola]